MPEIAIPLLLLDHIEPIEPANSLLGGLEPLLVTSLCEGQGRFDFRVRQLLIPDTETEERRQILRPWGFI